MRLPKLDFLQLVWAMIEVTCHISWTCSANDYVASDAREQVVGGLASIWMRLAGWISIDHSTCDWQLAHLMKDRQHSARSPESLIPGQIQLARRIIRHARNSTPSPRPRGIDSDGRRSSMDHPEIPPLLSSQVLESSSRCWHCDLRKLRFCCAKDALAEFSKDTFFSTHPCWICGPNSEATILTWTWVGRLPRPLCFLTSPVSADRTYCYATPCPTSEQSSTRSLTPMLLGLCAEQGVPRDLPWHPTRRSHSDNFLLESKDWNCSI